MHLLFASKLQHVMSHYTSNNGSVINKQTSLINNPQQLFNMLTESQNCLVLPAPHKRASKQNNNGNASQKWFLQTNIA